MALCKPGSTLTTGQTCRHPDHRPFASTAVKTESLLFKLSGLWHFVMAARANHYRLHAVCLFSLHNAPINSNFSSIATPSESSDSPKCSPAPTSHADLSLEGLNTAIHSLTSFLDVDLEDRDHQFPLLTPRSSPDTNKCSKDCGALQISNLGHALGIQIISKKIF